MKDTKRRLENFSFYDRTGMERHLEEMAQKGWLLEHIGNFGWKYRRIEPKKLLFTITHYSKATEFDPEMSEEQKTLHDFCEHSGWILAATSVSMQVFYNENENAVPIETDPQMELENIHMAMKRNYLWSYYILLGLSVMQCVMFATRLLNDPIQTLSSVSNLYTGIVWILLGIFIFLEIGGYFLWHRKAKRAAEQGVFLETKGNRGFQNFVLLVALGGALYWMLSLSGSLERMIGITGILYVFAVMVIVNTAKNFMKHKKVKASMNKTITWVTSFVVSFALMGCLTFFMMRAVTSGAYAKAENPEVEFYEHHGMTIEVYHDELPVEVDDLIGTDYDSYSTRWLVQKSPFVAEYEAEQRPHFNDLVSQPGLDYRIVWVKVPALYDWCFDEMYREYEENRHNMIEPEEERLRYVQIEDAAWNADAVYRVYRGDEAWNRYLICWGDCIVEFRPEWELDDVQKAIVAEKILTKN